MCNLHEKYLTEQTLNKTWPSVGIELEDYKVERTSFYEILSEWIMLGCRDAGHVQTFQAAKLKRHEVRVDERIIIFGALENEI